jgi:hypothetical protein
MALKGPEISGLVEGLRCIGRNARCGQDARAPGKALPKVVSGDAPKHHLTEEDWGIIKKKVV